MKVVKYILGVILILASIGGLSEGKIIAAVSIAVLGTLLLPPVTDWLKNKFILWQKKIVRYLSYIILFAMFASTIERAPDKNSIVSNTSEQSYGSQPSEQATESQPLTKEKEEKEISIGELTEVGNFVYKVERNTFKKTIGDEYFGKTADGIYLLVTLSIKNISGESRTLDNSLFKLTDSNGIEYEPSTDGTTAFEMSGGNSLFLKQCQPKITTKGTLVFEVPEKGTYDLHLSGGFWEGSTAIVEIK